MTATAPSPLSAAEDVSRVPGRTFVIAEAGVNQNGRMDLARELIHAAAKAGADAVKFQLFDPGTLTAKDAPLAGYQATQTAAVGETYDSQRDMLEALALPPEAFRDLQVEAARAGIMFLCSPFDEDSARYLHDVLALPLLKLPSGELTNLPYLRMLGALNTPVILSTGMATLEEVRTAVKTLRGVGSAPIDILHCVSAYPAPADTVNLRAIETLRQAFPDCRIGYSDHTLGINITLAAVAMGAEVIEKHYTLDKTLPGPDHPASLSVDELAAMIAGIREIESARGTGVKAPHPAEADVIRVARKSLVTARDLPAGHVLTEADLVIKRPGTGIPPSQLESTIGRRLTQAISADTVLPQHFLES